MKDNAVEKWEKDMHRKSLDEVAHMANKYIKKYIQYH